MAREDDPRLAEIRRQIGMGQRQMAAWELIMAEREAAEAKFPDQHLDQGTGPLWFPFDVDEISDPPLSLAQADTVAHFLKKRCQVIEPGDQLTWAKVIGEEYGEYIEASEPEHVKAELVQLGAMVLRALEDILATEDTP